MKIMYKKHCNTVAYGELRLNLRLLGCYKRIFGREELLYERSCRGAERQYRGGESVI